MLAGGAMRRELARMTIALLVANAAQAEPRNASAANAAVELEPILVAGQRPAPADSVSNASTIDRSEIASGNKSDLDKVLRGQSGITLLRSIRGTLSSFAIRGASSGQGQILLDGIPLYSGIGGAYNLDLLPPEAIEQAIVERGASVVRHGSLASGGAVRLLSRDSKETGANFHLQGGSFGTFAQSGTVALAGDRARVSLTGKHEDIFDGVSHADSRLGNPERDGFRGESSVLRYAAQPVEPLKLDGTLYYANSRTDLDSFGRARDGKAGLIDDPKFHAQTQVWLAQQTIQAQVSDAWQSSLQLGYHKSYVRLARDRLVGDSAAELLLLRWRNRHSVDTGQSSGEGLFVSWGTEAREERESATGQRGDFEGRRGQVAGLLDVDAAYGPWTFAAGGRLDHYDHRGTHGVYYVNSAWQLSPAFSVRAGAGHVYRLPTYHERFFPLFGNPALKPESSDSGELGFEWLPIEQFRLRVTGFYNRYRNKIRVSQSPILGSQIYANMLDSEVAGVEWDALYQDGPFTAGLQYTYQASRDLRTGLDVARVPEHQGKLFGAWRLPDIPLTLSSEVLYRSGYFNGLGATLYTPNAWWVNVQGEYAVSREVQVYVRGENLSDDRTPDDYRFGKPGAAVYGGVKLAFH